MIPAPAKCPVCRLTDGHHLEACVWAEEPPLQPVNLEAPGTLVQLVAHKSPALHHAAANLQAAQLLAELTVMRARGHADAADIQLMAALDRWSAGELV